MVHTRVGKATENHSQLLSITSHVQIPAKMRTMARCDQKVLKYRLQSILLHLIIKRLAGDAQLRSHCRKIPFVLVDGFANHDQFHILQRFHSRFLSRRKTLLREVEDGITDGYPVANDDCFLNGMLQLADVTIPRMLP